jgi:hypothetical protein
MHIDREQFQLPLAGKKSPPRKSAVADSEPLGRRLSARVEGMDQVLSAVMSSGSPVGTASPSIAGCARARSQQSAPEADEAGLDPTSSAGSRVMVRVLCALD